MTANVVRTTPRFAEVVAPDVGAAGRAIALAGHPWVARERPGVSLLTCGATEGGT